MDEYTPCKKPDPTAREAIGNVMRLLRTQRKKPNKYNARKTTVCGHTFDSKREAEVYLELLAQKQAVCGLRQKGRPASCRCCGDGA